MTKTYEMLIKTPVGFVVMGLAEGHDEADVAARYAFSRPWIKGGNNGWFLGQIKAIEAPKGRIPNKGATLADMARKAEVQKMRGGAFRVL